MAQSKGITNVKAKTFTFRVTKEMSEEIKEIKTKAASVGIRWNITQALTASLSAEIKAIQKHIQQKTDSDWLVGQTSLGLDEETSPKKK